MTEQEAVLIGRFHAQDGNGNVHTLLTYQMFIISETESGLSRIPSQKRLETIYGQPVDTIDENTFKLVELGLILKRI